MHVHTYIPEDSWFVRISTATLLLFQFHILMWLHSRTYIVLSLLSNLQCQEVLEASRPTTVSEAITRPTTHAVDRPEGADTAALSGTVKVDKTRGGHKTSKAMEKAEARRASRLFRQEQVQFICTCVH